MLVTLVAWGGQGDVRPIVALGQGFKAAGHAVRVAAPASFEPLITGCELEYRPMGGDPKRLLQGADLQAALEKTSGIAAMRSIARTVPPLVRQWMADAHAACQGADVTLGGVVPMFYVGASVAEKRGIPFIPCYLQPLTPTRAFPSFNLFSGTDLGGTLNRLSQIVALQTMWQPLRRAISAARRDVLGLPPAPFWGHFGDHIRKHLPVLYGFSHHVVPKPADWDTSTTVTGYWFLESSTGWTPPADLEAFLRAGPPPVSIGFGSMSSRDPAGVTRLALEALAHSGQRGVLLSGWSGMQRGELPDTIFMVDFAPHAWLFPQMAAVVHHGGAGTTGAALRAGAPAIVVPHNFDQSFWGGRVAALGAGPAPIPRVHLAVDSLARAITQATTDVHMRRRAAELGAAIRAEDGVARAVEVVEQAMRRI